MYLKEKKKNLDNIMATNCHFCKKTPEYISFRYFGKSQIYYFCSEECIKNANLCESRIRILDMGGCTKRLIFSNKMRKLWEDHIQWTRLFIISATHDIPDLDVTLKRLLSNQDDLGNLFGEFYGEETGLEITRLLKIHISGAGEVVTAAKNGNDTTIPLQNWYDNANQIAEYLYNLNTKYWDLNVLKEAMKKHLDDTLNEATHRLQQQFEADIIDYEDIHNHILVMADIFSEGIIRKFKKKF